MPNEEKSTNDKPKGNMLQNENGPEDETASAPGNAQEKAKTKETDQQNADRTTKLPDHKDD